MAGASSVRALLIRPSCTALTRWTANGAAYSSTRSGPPGRSGNKSWRTIGLAKIERVLPRMHLSLHAGAPGRSRCGSDCRWVHSNKWSSKEADSQSDSRFQIQVTATACSMYATRSLQTRLSWLRLRPVLCLRRHSPAVFSCTTTCHVAWCASCCCKLHAAYCHF